MKTIYSLSKLTANDSTIERQNIHSAKSKSAGFTLIELLVAVGIIAILIGLLLPAIQKKREEYAKNKATENLQALLVASQEYFARTGQYPDELADLRVVSGSLADDSFNRLVTTGRAEGYSYDFNNDGDVGGADFVIVAEPEFPGITGSITHTYDSDLGLITSNPTPGADAAREQMFNNIRAKAAETVVNLLKFDATATTQVREYCESPDNIASIVDYIDSDDDGVVSLTEVRFANTTFANAAVTDLVQDFFTFVAQEMKWDTLSEEASNAIFVAAGDLDGDSSQQPPLFSYDGLSILTLTVNGGAGNDLLTLLNKLEEAEAAEASGNQRGKAKAIKEYQKLVKAQIGHAFTRTNANTLITLSKTL